MASAAALLAAAALVQPQPVVVVPGLEVADLNALAGRGAVGLLVPDAGPRTSEARARASLARGEVINSLRGEAPSGQPLIEVSTASEIPPGEVIVLGLPAGGDQPNDRRYPIAVLADGWRGLLTSDSTRIPGLVSVADVARRRLEVRAADDPVAELRALDERIRENGEWRIPAFFVAGALLAALALFAPRAAVAGFVALLAANLAFGATGLSGLPATVATVLAAAVGGAAARHARLPLVALSIAVVAAYLGALAAEGTWVALSPLGPSQNGRFYGLSNLLETLLLVPAFVGASTRATFVPAAALAVVTVAGSSFGADGGGAIVLLAGFAVLAYRLFRWWGPAALAPVVSAAALAIVLGPETHVTQSAGAGSFADRLALSWERLTDDWLVALVTVLALAVLAFLAVRGGRRPLPMAMAIAIAGSMIVNDSPLEVAVGGLVGYLALDRYDSAR